MRLTSFKVSGRVTNTILTSCALVAVGALWAASMIRCNSSSETFSLENARFERRERMSSSTWSAVGSWLRSMV